MATVSSYVNYTAVDATDSFHNSPRFGHSNDFANLFSKNEDDQTDYVRGIIFAGVFIVSFYLVWLLVLLIFKCLGQKVGFLSGARMIDPETEHGQGGCTTRPNIVRLFFCLSTLVVIAFTVLLVSKGLTNLKNTTSSLDRSNAKVANILDQFQGIATDLHAVGLNANITRAQVLYELENFCPNNPNLGQQTGVDIEGAGQSAAALLQQLGDFITADVSNAQQQMSQAQRASKQIRSGIDKFDFRKLALAFIIIYIVLPTFMMLGVMMAWFGFSNPCICCMLSWLVLPMWIAMVIVAVFCAAMSSWMVVANADFCAGGQVDTPDATVKQILDYRNVTQSSFIGQVTYFYVTQCMTSDPWSFIRSYQANLTSANQTVAGLESELNQVGLSTLGAICGKDFSTINSLLLAMELTLSTLVKDSEIALNLLSCDSIVPIYTNTVYGTTCNYSVKALSWSFSSFLLISFFGMIMITLRSAWHDVMYTHDYEAKNLEPENYTETDSPPAEEEPRQWNPYDRKEPVIDYGNGHYDDDDDDDDNHHPAYRANGNRRANGVDESHDMSLYVDDDNDVNHHNNNVEYYEDPKVVHDPKHQDTNGFYRSSVY